MSCKGRCVLGKKFSPWAGRGGGRVVGIPDALHCACAYGHVVGVTGHENSVVGHLRSLVPQTVCPLFLHFKACASLMAASFSPPLHFDILLCVAVGMYGWLGGLAELVWPGTVRVWAGGGASLWCIWQTVHHRLSQIEFRLCVYCVCVYMCIYFRCVHIVHSNYLDFSQKLYKVVVIFLKWRLVSFSLNEMPSQMPVVGR